MNSSSFVELGINCIKVKCKFYKKMKNPRISKVEKLGFPSLCKFSESVTVDELLDALVVSDEPLKLVLIDAISVGTAELVNDSIQARFGGVGPPTAIKDANEIITYLSDLVTMQVHSRETSVISAHASVSVSPVLACLDGGVHQFLNLTHGDDNKGEQWCSLRSAVGDHLRSSQQVTQGGKFVEALIILDEGAVKSTIKSINVTLNVSDGRSDGASNDCSGHGWCGGQQNQYRADGALGQDLSASSSGVTQHAGHTGR